MKDNARTLSAATTKFQVIILRISTDSHSRQSRSHLTMSLLSFCHRCLCCRCCYFLFCCFLCCCCLGNNNKIPSHNLARVALAPVSTAGNLILLSVNNSMMRIPRPLPIRPYLQVLGTLEGEGGLLGDLASGGPSPEVINYQTLIISPLR